MACFGVPFHGVLALVVGVVKHFQVGSLLSYGVVA